MEHIELQKIVSSYGTDIVPTVSMTVKERDKVTPIIGVGDDTIFQAVDDAVTMALGIPKDTIGFGMFGTVSQNGSGIRIKAEVEIGHMVRYRGTGYGQDPIEAYARALLTAGKKYVTENPQSF